MNKFRPFILLAAIAMTAFISFGIMPKQIVDLTSGSHDFFGVLTFSRIGYVIFNVVVFLIFLLSFAIEGVRGRLKAAKVFKQSMMALVASVAALAVGELVAYISAVSCAVAFKPFGLVHGVTGDKIVMAASIVLMAILAAVVYISFRNKAIRSASSSMRASAGLNAVKHYAGTTLYGTMALQFIASVILLLVDFNNSVTFIPLFCASVAMALYRLLPARVWLLLAVSAILLHVFSCIGALAVSLTIGGLGVVMAIVLADLMLLIPLSDLYLIPDRKK